MSLFLNSSVINGVEGADFYPLGHIETFFELQAEGQGWYNFTLAPTILGSWNATFRFTKTGFEPQAFNFVMTVEKIPIAIAPGVTLNSTYTLREFGQLNLTLSFIANDTGAVVSGATAEYYIMRYETHQPIGFPQRFTETHGQYITDIDIPGVGLYILSIAVSKENHTTLSLTMLLNVEPDLIAATMNTIYNYLPFLGQLGGLFVAAVIGRQALKKRTARRNLELMAYESRFDDAGRIIGFFVIHRQTGLPIYSKVLKGGLEEALVSGFISAVSHFRSEFEEEERLWGAVQISELITAVQTEVLICAIFTTSRPSSKQIENLEALGRAVGALFDHETETLTRITAAAETADVFEKTFSQIFRDYFDGHLLDVYWGLNKDLLTREYRPLERSMTELDAGAGVRPTDLVKAMVLAGTDELKAFRLVVNAIEAGLLISLDKDHHLFTEFSGATDDDDPDEFEYEVE
jgi:hypothetical protein